MSPRKSSTSSGRPPVRPRYLGLVAESDRSGYPTVSEWVDLLKAGLLREGQSNIRFRIVRTAGPRALVEVGHLESPSARRSWNPREEFEGFRLSTRRTWGTLKDGKAWLRGGDPTSRKAPGSLDRRV